MHASSKEKVSEQLPRFVERLLDSVCALLLFLVVASTIEVSVISVVASAIVVVTGMWLTWRRWGSPAAVVGGVAAVVVVGIVGPAFVCGLLAVAGYYAVSLWYLGAPPMERLLDVPLPLGDGKTRTLREQLGRVFRNA